MSDDDDEGVVEYRVKRHNNRFLLLEYYWWAKLTNYRRTSIFCIHSRNLETHCKQCDELDE